MPNLMPQLTKNERSALNEFRQHLAKKFGQDLLLVKLFGSKARGDFHQESDLDVLVVLKAVKPGDRRWIAGLALDVSTDNNVFISQLVFSALTWKTFQAKHFSLARNLEDEGVRI